MAGHKHVVVGQANDAVILAAVRADLAKAVGADRLPRLMAHGVADHTVVVRAPKVDRIALKVDRIGPTVTTGARRMATITLTVIEAGPKAITMATTITTAMKAMNMARMDTMAAAMRRHLPNG
jgi:hypothetical protein